MLCLFSRTKVAGSPLGIMIQSQFQVLITAPGIGFMAQALNRIRKWLATPKIFMPLLHQWACLALLVSIVVHSIHSFRRWMIPFLFQQCASYLALLTLASRDGVSRQCQSDFSMFCDLDMWRLQEQSFTVRFRRINKSIDNSL